MLSLLYIERLMEHRLGSTKRYMTSDVRIWEPSIHIERDSSFDLGGCSVLTLFLCSPLGLRENRVQKYAEATAKRRTPPDQPAAHPVNVTATFLPVRRRHPLDDDIISAAPFFRRAVASGMASCCEALA